LDSQPYGYSWMTVHEVAFGIGKLDSQQLKVSGFACRVPRNLGFADDHEFCYVVYDDLNHDSKCQASEILAQETLLMPAGVQEVHVQEVQLRGPASRARIVLSAHQNSKNLATYEGSFKF